MIQFPTPGITRLQGDVFRKGGVEVDMLRLDLLHPEIQGNKYYKLKYNLERARKEGFSTLLTYGGPWSNHLYATAAAGKLAGFNTIGVVRGMHHETPTLAFAVAQGMLLVRTTREEYAGRTSPSFQEKLKETYGPYYLIPEGGSNLEGTRGAMEILPRGQYDIVCCACGTGTTLAGLALSASHGTRIFGFSPFAGHSGLLHDVDEKMREIDPEADVSGVSIIEGYHFGGFGKWSDELIRFMDHFEKSEKIALDLVYTSKMMYGLSAMIAGGSIADGCRVLAVHTGGLQGNAGRNHGD
ncbi:MAG: pyridoxal-phosphate dependent enzyme [Flavobacteriales bacterium]|nr:pyridoxal-phosphate dependent enzyme [Flavobacteriales bacterium]